MSDSDTRSADRTPLRVCAVEVAGYAGRVDEIELSLARIPRGNTVMAQAEAEGEDVSAVFMGVLHLMVSDGHGGIREAAEGMGMVGLSDQRAFGVLLEGQGLEGRCTVDREGNGRVVVYTIDRSLFVKHKPIQGGGWRKKTKAVSLIGDVCALTLEVTARQSAAGRFEKANSDDLLGSTQGWL